MKKANTTKKNPASKKIGKAKDSGELRKPAKLKPLKEKEKKNWKSNVDDEDDGFTMDESDLKIDSDFDEMDNEDDGFYDDKF